MLDCICCACVSHMIKDTCLQNKHVLVTFRHDMLRARFRRQDTCLCFSSHHKLDLARQQPHTLGRICLRVHKSARISTLPHQICCAERGFSLVERHACAPGGACLSCVEIDTFSLHVQEHWASLMTTCHVFCEPMSICVSGWCYMPAWPAWPLPAINTRNTKLVI